MNMLLRLLRHVNNGIYFSMMDLARVDLMIRAGYAGKVKQQGWYPVVVAETIQFRRSLNLFQRFEIETRVLGWDDKAIVLEQQFIRGGESVAHALVRGINANIYVNEAPFPAMKPSSAICNLSRPGGSWQQPIALQLIQRLPQKRWPAACRARLRLASIRSSPRSSITATGVCR
jgi:acyl-CoA thioesterase FadM